MSDAKRKGSGRTKGAVSLVSVKLSDLTAKFSPEDLIVVGRVFIRKAGILTDTPAVSAPLPEEAKAGLNLVEA